MDLDDNSNPTSTPSLRRPPAQRDVQLDPDRHHIYRKVVGMLIWASLVRPDLQFTAKDHTRHLASPTVWDWSHLKHTLRYIKGTLHYKILISPRLPQGHLRQLTPLHINAYCDSDWATDKEVYLRHRTHQYLEYLSHSTTEHSLQSQHHQRRLNSTPSASASATACTSTSYFKNFTTSTMINLRLWQHRASINLSNSFTTSPSLTTTKVTDSHLHRQYINTEPQQQAWPQ